MRALTGLVACAAALAFPAAAQQPATTWQQVVEIEGSRGEVKNLAIASNGDIIVSGFVSRAGANIQGSASDAWLARYSADGRRLWSQTLGGSARDEALGLALDPDGSIILVGWRDGVFTQKVRTNSGFAARYSPDGKLLWDVTLQDQKRYISISDVQVLDDGSLLLTGQDTPTDEAGARVVVAKLSAAGQMQWTFTPSQIVPGPAQEMKGVLLVSRPDGQTFAFERARLGRMIAGQSVEVHILQDGGWEQVVARCSVVALNTGVAADADCGAPVPEGLFTTGIASAFTGDTAGGYYNGNPVLRKHGAGGAEMWIRTLESEPSDGINTVTATPDGGVIGVGFVLDGPSPQMHNWDGLLVKLDAAGNEVWRRRFGGTRRDELTSVGILPDGSIVVAGYTGSQGGASDWAPWLLRLNSSGELEGEAKQDLQRRQK